MFPPQGLCICCCLSLKCFSPSKHEWLDFSPPSRLCSNVTLSTAALPHQSSPSSSVLFFLKHLSPSNIPYNLLIILFYFFCLSLPLLECKLHEVGDNFLAVCLLKSTQWLHLRLSELDRTQRDGHFSDSPPVYTNLWVTSSNRDWWVIVNISKNLIHFPIYPSWGYMTN